MAVNEKGFPDTHVKPKVGDRMPTSRQRCNESYTLPNGVVVETHRRVSFVWGTPNFGLPLRESDA